MKHRYPIVQIRWVDSAGNSQHGWEDTKTARHVIKVDTVGYLIDDKPEFVTIASSVTEDQVYEPISIPKCSILSKKTLLRP